MLSLEAIAYEEAGHAVAATILNVPFIDVTISALGGRVRPKGERKFEDRYFLVSLAGPVARLRFDASTAWAAVLDDTAQVKPMFVKAGCEAEYDDLYARTEQFIDAHWPEVERVAQALLTNNMLSPEAVRAAMTHV